jgi:glycerophosphoryl diester phosphodiesterase
MATRTRISSWPLEPGTLSRPLVIAHRGDVESSPENTMEAFRGALEKGTDGVELDVRLSRDGHVVVMHDRRVDRTTNGRGPVGNLTLAQLKELDAGSWYDARFKGVKVPTLDEVLEELPRDFLLDVELKVRGWGVMALARRVSQVIKRHDRMEGTLVASFNPMALFAMRLLGSEIPRGYIWSAHHPYPISHRWLSPLAKAQWMNPDHKTMTPRMLAHFHRQGKLVLAWDMDVHGVDGWPNPGIDGVVTDSVSGALKRRDEAVARLSS